jgi:hypothetical protein
MYKFFTVFTALQLIKFVGFCILFFLGYTSFTLLIFVFYVLINLLAILFLIVFTVCNYLVYKEDKIKKRVGKNVYNVWYI